MIDPLGSEKSFGFLRTAMDASSIGHQVNAANLANIDTPGYRSVKMNFEDILKDYEDQANMTLPDKSDSSTLPPPPALNFKDYVVEETAGNLTERWDGNNVNLDIEMGAMAKHRGRFQMASQFLNRKIHLMNEVILSGR